MKQDPKEIEEFYKERADPWDYQTTPDDALRRELIVEIAKTFSVTDGWATYVRALDIGAGEGWITGALPAESLYGLELSDTAAARFPPHVMRAHKPDGEYDLVICTGALYAHYDYEQFIAWINAAANNIVITCNIKQWEIGIDLIKGKQVFGAEFPYRSWTQKLRVFRV